MKIAFITFTCARDASLVHLWAAAVRRLAPDALLVCAVDQADATMALPRKCLRVVTTFDRQGNLNGIPAVQGILGTLAAVGEELGADIVVKMDCDTVLTGASWLRWLEEVEFLGFEGGVPLTATGICYAVRTTAARRLADAVQPWRWRTTGKFPEDQTIFSLALLHTRARLVPWETGKMVQAFLPPHFQLPEIPLQACAAVHCGQAEFLAEYGSASTRAELVKSAMVCLLRAGARAGLDA